MRSLEQQQYRKSETGNAQECTFSKIRTGCCQDRTQEKIEQATLAFKKRLRDFKQTVFSKIFGKISVINQPNKC